MINFDKLSNRQLAVFEQIATNNDSGHPPSTLNALERLGYIQGSLEQLRGFPPVSVVRYSVPVSVHIAWCQWCAKQQAEKGKE